MRHKNWITAAKLEVWADTLPARALLPQLLRRLVHASVPPISIQQLEFPSGEGVQRPGIDGVSITTSSNAKVPVGKTAWEIGCDKGIKSKADDDYIKRKPESNAAFVFVTPRKWSLKQQWSEERRKTGQWKDVRTYDSSDLEEWLELAPAVDIWLAHEIGHKPPGVTDLATHWKNVVASLRLPIPPAVVLTDREAQVKQFRDRLAEEPAAITIEASSTAEIIDFIAGLAASLPEDEQGQITSRAVVVEDREAWRALAGSGGNLVLIAAPQLDLEAELISEAIRQGHHVVFLASRQRNADCEPIKLRRMFSISLHKALVSSGMSDSEAQRISSEAGGSFTILKRLLSIDSLYSAPKWSLGNEATALASLMLLGAWDDSNSADKEALEFIASRSYADLLALANRLRTENDAPLVRCGSTWSFLSRADSWRLLSWSLTGDVLDRFEKKAVEIFSEANPAYELPVDERYLASIKGKTMRFSYALREGLAETLGLMGLADSPVGIGDVCSLSIRASRVVRKVFEGADWLRWASLSSHLPDLAEAAPDEFLQAVESDLKSDQPELPKLFDQEGDGLFAGSPHTGLLWALECLAWDQRYLGRTSLCLARLAALDLGGRISNRPSQSLRDIFLLWHPQTTASSVDRLTILSRMLRLCPDAGWKLLLSLLPKSHDSTSGNYKPKWQQWAARWKDGVTHGEHHEAVLAVSELLIANASNGEGRWLSLAEHLTELPNPAFERVIEALQMLNDDSCSSENRNRIWSCVRSNASRYRWAMGLDWALPEEIVQKMEGVAHALAPSDPVKLHAWLFDSGAGLHIGHHGQGHDEMEKLLLSAQVDALGIIWPRLSLDGIIEIARSSGMPWKVGKATWKARLTNFPENQIPPLLLAEEVELRQFARGFLGSCFDEQGWPWLEGQDLDKWPAAQSAELLSIISFQPRVWELAASIGSEADRLYWKKTWCHAHKLGVAEVNHVVAKLNEAQRALSVLDFLDGALHSSIELETELIIGALERVLTSDEPIEEKPGDVTMVQHHLGELYRAVRDREDAPNDRLVTIEWASIDLLDSLHLHPLRLHRVLAEEPSLFATLLSYCYRARSEREKPKEDLTEAEKIRGRRAHKLLESWVKPPGLRNDGSFDAETLSSWIREVRHKLSEIDRLYVGDKQIGKLLFHCPLDSDGKWPCLPVRDVLEDLNSVEMLRGFELAIINSRGVYSRSLTEGGEQEREFARKFQGYADQIRAGWPMVAAALERVADGYRRDAERVDEEAYER